MTEENTAHGEEEVVAEAKADAKKTPQDFIIERKQKQLEKALADAKQLEEEMKVFKPSEDDMDSKIAKAVTQRLEIDTTVNSFIKKYPSLAEKRGEIEKYAYDPSRQGVPIETRILEAVGVEEFIKLGAKTKAEAELDAKNSRMGGDSAMTETEKTKQQEKSEQYKKVFANQGFMKNAQKAYDQINS